MDKPRLIDVNELPRSTVGICDAQENCYGATEVVFADDIDAAPVVDPVHAAGGCYCRECKFHDGTIPGNPNILCYHMHDDDFCSYGELKAR